MEESSACSGRACAEGRRRDMALHDATRMPSARLRKIKDLLTTGASLCQTSPSSRSTPPGSPQARKRRRIRIASTRVVCEEIEAAGFRFLEAADFLMPDKAGTAAPETSQYVLKFQKPRPK